MASARLRLFPLHTVLFPGALLNLHVFETRYKQMIRECLETGEGFGVALIAEGAEAGDPNVTPHGVGSIAQIVDVEPLPYGRCFISAIGGARFKIASIVSRQPYLLVEAEMFEEEGLAGDGESERLHDRVRTLFWEYLDIVLEFSGEASPVELPYDAQSASFLIGDTLQMTEAAKQRLLEFESTQERLAAEAGLLEELLPQLRRLLDRRRRELDARRERGAYFSLN